MIHPHVTLIERFYRAFQQRDAAAMAACYHTEIHFSDPAFPNLHGADAGAMWAMLCARGKDLRVEFADIRADDVAGSARWDAYYSFSATRRPVHNRIHATFRFRDGLVVRHEDHFNFWRWSRQALGPIGLLLGWTPVLRTKVQRTAAASLKAWRATLLLMLMAFGANAQDTTSWPVHSMTRPKPPVVAPGRTDPPESRPTDAIILFDGTSLKEWQQADGTPARWTLVDGAMEVVRGTGSLRTLREFGSFQLHIEWRSPPEPRGDGQNRGNSGVYMMGLYELQILDSYQNETYADGQAAALYGQQPPRVNASRPPGEWQSYDVLFRRPIFGADGKVVTPATITVVHNDVVVHTGVEFTGATVHMRRAEYTAHADRGPILLQDHGDPVRFRNIWVRELADR